MAINPLGGGSKPLRPVLTPEEQDKKLREVSQMYEKQFLREMVKAMRGTVNESELVKVGQAEKIFREQLDGEYADKWGEKGGIGLADLIHSQLLERYGTKLGIKAPIGKPFGPIALNESSRFRASPLQGTVESGTKTTYRFDRSPVPETDLRVPRLGGDELRAPWSGLLSERRDLGDGQQLLDIRHDNGLRSQIVFRGAQAPPAGTALGAGDRVGLLSPEANRFFWTIENGLPSDSE